MTQSNEAKLNQLIQDLEENPMVIETRLLKEKERREQRQAATKKIAELEKDKAEQCGQLQGELKEKQANYERLKAECDASKNEVFQVKARLLGISTSLDNKISRERAILWETADNTIDKAVEFFQERIKYFSEPGRISKQAYRTGTDLFSMGKKTQARTNYPAITEALTYCRKALRELDALKLSAENPAARIEALKVGIPKVDSFTTYDGEKPLPRLADNHKKI